MLKPTGMTKPLTSNPSPSPRSETADRILDLAETLIQTRGYSAISYQDIADGVGIRKASIHYHFPSKGDLGAAVVDRYAQRFGDMVTAMIADPTVSALKILEGYTRPFLEFSETADRVCLCGALAGEYPALPQAMQSRVDRFFTDHQRWLAEILDRGARDGEFILPAGAADVARSVFSALQGALLVKRATGDGAQVRSVVAVIKAQLAPR